MTKPALHPNPWSGEVAKMLSATWLEIREGKKVKELVEKY